MFLTEEQLDHIALKIKDKGLSYQPLKEEMIDHFACLIEMEMEKNEISFSEATQHVFDGLPAQHIAELEQATISLLSHKSTTMQKMSKLISACAAFLVLGLFICNYPILPEEKEYTDNDRIFRKANSVYSEKNRTESASRTQNSGSTKPFSINSNESMVIPKPTLVLQIDPPSRFPLDQGHEITSGFGMRFHPLLRKKKMHRGIDLKATIGTPVYATADGVIEKVVTHNAYGKMIVLKHDENYQTLYAQLSTFEVKKGAAVKKGTLIGRVGSSGLSTAPHLHYEVLKDGKPVNPEKYF